MKQCCILYAGKIDNRRYQKTNTQEEYDKLTYDMAYESFKTILKNVINTSENSDWNFDIYAHCWETKYEKFIQNLLNNYSKSCLCQPVEIQQPSRSVALSIYRANQLKINSNIKYDVVLWVRWDQMFKKPLILNKMNPDYFWSAGWNLVVLDHEDDKYWHGIVNDHRKYHHNMLADHWFYTSSENFNIFAYILPHIQHRLFHSIAYQACIMVNLRTKYSYHAEFFFENMARDNFKEYKTDFEIIDFNIDHVNNMKKSSLDGFKVKIPKSSRQHLIESYYSQVNIQWLPHMTSMYHYLIKTKK